jgi:hypothetical protein
MRVHGRCPGCGYLRMLPGRSACGEPVCASCAGITRDFRCTRCRHEGHPWAGRLCARCVLHDQLTSLLDDGTGRTRPELVPLLESLRAMPQPDRGLNWIHNNARLRGYLRGLARGDIPLSHAALHDLPSWRTAAHLRDLLMACGALPDADRRILLFEQWYLRQLAAVTDPGHQRLLRQYATWDQLARLHAAARAGRLTTGARNRAAGQFTCATRFLSWLTARRRHLAGTTQASIDDWHVTHPRHHGNLRGFLTWAITTRHAPPLNIPAAPRAAGEPITQDNRLTLLHRALTDDRQPLRTRVAACLVLPCAQPVSRLTRLTIDDVLHDDGQTLLRFGDPPTPVPEPFATLLNQLATGRANMNTAANPTARWLFPGGRPGQPLTPGALLPSLRHLGIPATQARTAALRDLVLQAPAPVIAQALGYSHTTTHRHHSDAGGTWSHYPPQHSGPGFPVPQGDSPPAWPRPRTPSRNCCPHTICAWHATHPNCPQDGRVPSSPPRSPRPSRASGTSTGTARRPPGETPQHNPSSG